MPDSPRPDPDALRARLAADIAAGKTISLSSADLAHPEVRSQLPELLEELTHHDRPHAGPVRVPGYTLLGEIGHGGMSTVWLARHDTLQRHVAIKIAPKWLAGDKKMRTRLLQEARAMAKVSHHNIVAIHDILDVDDSVAIAMEWIDGLTLAALLAALPREPRADDVHTLAEALGRPAAPTPFASNVVEFFVRIVRDIALALHHVHGAGLLHLDIKPSNILVRRDGTPLLADFGVVREIDLATTHTHTFAGTPVYAAPEQLERKDAAFGPHTDVYGLGMTLYEMLARRQPLRELDLTRVLLTVLGGRLPPLTTHAPIAADLANIVHKAIAPETEHRYPSAQALADDLTAFLEHRPVSARPLSWLQRLRRQARREPWKALLAVVLLVAVPALAGLGLYVLIQQPRIERSLAQERRAQANSLAMSAYQNYFITQRVVGEPSHLLQQAMELAPEPTTLACLLAMMHEEGLAATRDLLHTHAAMVEQHDGLRRFADKVVAGRAFFTKDEVRQLRTSTDVVDRYVLALDRLFHAEDADYEAAYLEAEQCLDEAQLMAGRDALLLGLQTWAAARSGSPARSDALASAIRLRARDDPPMIAWLYYSMEPLMPEAAGQIAQSLCDEQPRLAMGWEMLAGEALRRAKPDLQRCLQFVRRADDANAGSAVLEMYRLTAMALGEGKAAAERALREIQPDLMTEIRRLRLTRLVDRDAATRLRGELLAAQPASPRVLEALFRDACNAEHNDHIDLAWSLWHDRFPDRRRLHFDRFGELVNRHQMEAAAALLPELTAPRRMQRGHWTFVCSALVTAHDWPTLDRHAQHWLAVAAETDLGEAAFYTGLAAARCGHDEAAARAMAIATALPATKGMWYGHALLELAWLHVRPDGPTLLRNPALAQHRVDALLAYTRGRPFPLQAFACLVQAEVAFANGNRARATELVDQGLTQPVETHAPDDTRQRLLAAAKRYRGE